MICRVCGIDKPKEEFYFRKDSGKYRTECKECFKEHKRQYRNKNKEKYRKYSKKWRNKNKEKERERSKKYRENNKEKERKRNKKYRENNKEKEIKRSKKYRENNKEKVRKQRRKYKNKKRKNDSSFKIKENLRRRINKAIKGKNKSAKTIELLGCTIDFLKEHLESQFQEGMSWENYGYYGWHIDHVIPCSAFNLTDPEQQKQCFHYTNLQPLWAEDNLKKATKNKFK